MNEGALFMAKSLAWVLVTSLCWVYADYGYSSSPRFDRWFWGISFVISLLVLAASVFAIRIDHE